ncbi:LOW QUALITY PROTEIN: serine/threonine-protein phosphatase 6 regulatory ankyrin repeat subunit B [Procambarus clarkii]|uniref:LOW QUALITY PROTEIN: serine/threonine-protein phosphatase 6 regulatory ankyrin repeat subunit B n=1 Tax=Procambarus clarkii TaxID=6728 RepID=UPI003742E054
MIQEDNTAATQALVSAVRNGDKDGVETAIHSGGDIHTSVPRDDPDVPGGSLLTLAAYRGCTSVVPVLLSAGHHVDSKGAFPYTPLQVAVHCGHQQIVTTLIDAHADVNAKDQHGEYHIQVNMVSIPHVKRSPKPRNFTSNNIFKALQHWLDYLSHLHFRVTSLHLAARRARTSCARALINAGADLDAQDSALRTPLHVSVLSYSTDNTEVMKLLLDAGCNYRALNNTAFTAMHVAALSGNEKAVQELCMAGLNPEERDEFGLLPEDIAEAWGKHNTAWLLRKMPQRTKRTSPKPILQMLSTRVGPVPSVVTYDGQTPADLARMASHEDLASTIMEATHPQLDDVDHVSEVEHVNTDAVCVCLRLIYEIFQAGVSAPALYKELLMVISAGDDVAEASRLLRSGAPLEPVGDFYTSALVLAVTCNRPRILSLLVAAGAPLTTCSGGLSLLQLAWRSHDVTIRLRVLVTRHFLHALQAEERRVRPQDSALREGIDHLVTSLRGETPWHTSWPLQADTDHTSLMVSAATNNCPLTAIFLRQAGAKSFLQDQSGITPLHAALDAHHWDLAQVMVKHIGACLYIPDSSGRLPLDMLPHTTEHRWRRSPAHSAEYAEDLIERMKDKEEQDQLHAVLEDYTSLFTSYRATPTLAQGPPASEATPQHSPSALMGFWCAAGGGLLQLAYLLVTVGGLSVDSVVDATHDSTALHQAASHGVSGCLALLLSLGASALKRDRYGHTPSHFAAMFGHSTTYQQLEVFLANHEPVSKAGTTPSEISNNFTDYLYRYLKSETDQGEDWCSVNPLKLFRERWKLRRSKEVVTREVQNIMDRVSAVDRLYEGSLSQLEVHQMEPVLYAPDEYDLSVVLSNIPEIKVEIVEQSAYHAALSGHRLRVRVKTDHPSLQGKTLINNFYELVKQCWETHTIESSQLSLVPPGVTRTQVGVALTLAWQGKEYPLLLIGIDLVPVVAIPWPAEVSRPPLTPANIKQVYLSNTADGEWRCSFAGAEAEVLSQLDSQERRVYVACKTLLSHLKAEPWMPREVKANYTWWDSRKWKIMIPAGFAMKNSFLNQLQRKREEKREWRDEDLIDVIITILRDMCKDFSDPTTAVESLVPTKVYAYFGGEFEKPKTGEGAPEIIKILREIQQHDTSPKSWLPNLYCSIL